MPKPKPTARIFRADSLWTASLPEPDPLLVDTNGQTIFTKPSISIIIAQRGAGKSMFGLGMSLAIATGTSFLPWRAPVARRVLYIDGEMTGSMVKKRLIKMATAMGLRRNDVYNLSFLSRDWQDDNHMPHLETPEGRRFLENFLQQEADSEREIALENEIIAAAIEAGEPEYLLGFNPEVIIFDNAMSLFDPAGEVELTILEKTTNFLKKLRSAGMTPVVIHHTGWDSSRGRGLSAREDFVENVCVLQLPKGYSKREGCRFDFRFTKGRDIYGDAAAEFEGRYNDTDGWLYTIQEDIGLDPYGDQSEVEDEPSDTEIRIETDILLAVAENPNISRNRIVSKVKGTKALVLKSVSRLIDRKQLIEYPPHCLNLYK